jgi:epoxyqueuosine reductase
MLLTQSIKERARELGFDRVGVTPARPSPRLDAYLDWIEAGMHGQMAYMARPDRVARRRDLELILPGVRSVVVVALDYFTLQPPPEIALDPSRGRISNYAWGRDYHAVMTPRLEELAAFVRDEAPGQVAHRAYVDTGPILERDHAEQAGLGFTGKNTLRIAPHGGSYAFLGELLLTVDLDYDEPFDEGVGCGACTRCLVACPTQAFSRPYALDARRCISYLSIELKGPIPRDLRPQMGNWVYGCDACQEVCPFQRFAQTTWEEAFYPQDYDDMAPPLLDLLALDEDAFNHRFADSPIKRIGRDRLVRNACVAAGNWGEPDVFVPLAGLLRDSSPLVRGHAAWALGRIGENRAGATLSDALKAETDDYVREELESALAAAR